MSVHPAVTRLPPARHLRVAFASSLAALALPALGTQGSLLEITVGPHDTGGLEAKELKVKLDGAPLNVTVPVPGADSAVPVYSDVIRPGKHTVEVEARFVGKSNVFSYVEGYVFRMNGQLDIDAPPGQAVVLNVKVVTKSGITVEWTSKFKLALQADHYQSERAAASRIPDVEPPANALAAMTPDETRLPPPEPRPARFVPRQGAGACTLDPPHFRFAKYDLQPADRVRLNRFAICLKESGDAVLIEGHSDPRGNAEYNQWLSAQRADEVVEYLVKQGVARSRLATQAYGFKRRDCTEKTESCFARNRRAEAIVSQP